MVRNVGVLLGLLISVAVNADVVINEISYNPPDEQYTAGSLREFIELYNPGSESVDLSGYQFTKGTPYVFPEGATLASHAYLVLARDPSQRIWNRKPYLVLGPFDGKLSNSGETLTLTRPDGTVVEKIKYDDEFPWSRKADGYGSTLERIAWDLPANDFHSWRASLLDEGTPGEANSVTGVLPRPVILAHEFSPPNPTSNDDVTVRLGFDAANLIRSVTLQWEIAEQGSEGGSYEGPELYVSAYDNFQFWKGTQSPSEGTEWILPEFDDSSWRRGQGTFGYGGSWWDRNGTELNDMRNQYSTIYLRRDFSITDANSLQNAYLQVTFSGGFVCYLNGVEIARANAPQVVAHDSLATQAHDINAYELYVVPNVEGFFKNEGNTLAVVGLNNRLNQTQFRIGVYLFEGERKPESVPDVFNQVAMTRVADNIESATFEAQLPALASQTLVRMNAKVTLNDGSSTVLPYVTELPAYLSFFVYDGEIDSLLPVLWPYFERSIHITEMEIVGTGAVILPAGQKNALVFDGAMIYSSRNGQKLKFLKGDEYQGDRTLNILPERPSGGTTSGSSTPHREDLAFEFFKDFGIPAPRTEWYRMIENGKHTQRLLIQQVNERCLEMNGLNPDADLFKRNYVSPNWEPHTNLENGTKSIDALTRSLQTSNQESLHEALTTNLVVDEFMSYIVASVLTSNWDGFHNNHWMYLDPDTQQWQIIPWDLDKAWGYTDSDPMFVEMPIDFPLNGQARQAGREPGPITGRFMRDTILYNQYKERLGIEFNQRFTEEKMFARINEKEDFLLADLALVEQQTGTAQNTRRNQILDSYDIIRTFVQLRRAYLAPFLPTPVSHWSLY